MCVVATHLSLDTFEHFDCSGEITHPCGHSRRRGKHALKQASPLLFRIVPSLQPIPRFGNSFEKARLGLEGQNHSGNKNFEDLHLDCRYVQKLFGKILFVSQDTCIFICNMVPKRSCGQSSIFIL